MQGVFSILQPLTPVKSLFQYILKRLIGNYFLTNLDFSKFFQNVQNSSILEDLELNTVKLNEVFFRNSPFLLKKGIVKTLKFTIPWANLLTQNIEISIEEIRLELLENIAFYKEKNKSFNENNEKSEKSADFNEKDRNSDVFHKIVNKILRNLRLQVKSLVIDYQENFHKINDIQENNEKLTISLYFHDFSIAQQENRHYSIKIVDFGLNIYEQAIKSPVLGFYGLVIDIDAIKNIKIELTRHEIMINSRKYAILYSFIRFLTEEDIGNNDELCEISSFPKENVEKQEKIVNYEENIEKPEKTSDFTKNSDFKRNNEKIDDFIKNKEKSFSFKPDTNSSSKPDSNDLKPPDCVSFKPDSSYFDESQRTSIIGSFYKMQNPLNSIIDEYFQSLPNIPNVFKEDELKEEEKKVLKEIMTEEQVIEETKECVFTVILKKIKVFIEKNEEINKNYEFDKNGEFLKNEEKTFKKPFFYIKFSEISLIKSSKSLKILVKSINFFDIIINPGKTSSDDSFYSLNNSLDNEKIELSDSEAHICRLSFIAISNKNDENEENLQFFRFYSKNKKNHIQRTHFLLENKPFSLIKPRKNNDFEGMIDIFKDDKNFIVKIKPISINLHMKTIEDLMNFMINCEKQIKNLEIRGIFNRNLDKNKNDEKNIKNIENKENILLFKLETSLFRVNIMVPDKKPLCYCEIQTKMTDIFIFEFEDFCVSSKTQHISIKSTFSEVFLLKATKNEFLDYEISKIMSIERNSKEKAAFSIKLMKNNEKNEKTNKTCYFLKFMGNSKIYLNLMNYEKILSIYRNFKVFFEEDFNLLSVHSEVQSEITIDQGICSNEKEFMLDLEIYMKKLSFYLFSLTADEESNSKVFLHNKFNEKVKKTALFTEFLGFRVNFQQNHENISLKIGVLGLKCKIPENFDVSYKGFDVKYNEENMINDIFLIRSEKYEKMSDFDVKSENYCFSLKYLYKIINKSTFLRETHENTKMEEKSPMILSEKHSVFSEMVEENQEILMEKSSKTEVFINLNGIHFKPMLLNLLELPEFLSFFSKFANFFENAEKIDKNKPKELICYEILLNNVILDIFPIKIEKKPQNSINFIEFADSRSVFSIKDLKISIESSIFSIYSSSIKLFFLQNAKKTLVSKEFLHIYQDLHDSKHILHSFHDTILDKLGFKPLIELISLSYSSIKPITIKIKDIFIDIAKDTILYIEPHYNSVKNIKNLYEKLKNAANIPQNKPLIIIKEDLDEALQTKDIENQEKTIKSLYNQLEEEVFIEDCEENKIFDEKDIELDIIWNLHIDSIILKLFPEVDFEGISEEEAWEIEKEAVLFRKIGQRSYLEEKYINFNENISFLYENHKSLMDVYQINHFDLNKNLQKSKKIPFFSKINPRNYRKSIKIKVKDLKTQFSKGKSLENPMFSLIFSVKDVKIFDQMNKKIIGKGLNDKDLFTSEIKFIQNDKILKQNIAENADFIIPFNRIAIHSSITEICIRLNPLILTFLQEFIDYSIDKPSNNNEKQKDEEISTNIAKNLIKVDFSINTFKILIDYEPNYHNLAYILQNPLQLINIGPIKDLELKFKKIKLFDWEIEKTLNYCIEVWTYDIRTNQKAEIVKKLPYLSNICWVFGKFFEKMAALVRFVRRN